MLILSTKPNLGIDNFNQSFNLSFSKFINANFTALQYDNKNKNGGIARVLKDASQLAE